MQTEHGLSLHRLENLCSKFSLCPHTLLILSFFSCTSPSKEIEAWKHTTHVVKSMASENSGRLILMTLPTGRRSSYKGQGPESMSLPHAPSLWPANRMHAENFRCGHSSGRGKESLAPRGEGCAVLCFNGGGGSTCLGERGVVFAYCSLSRRGSIYQHFISMFQEKKTL